MFSRLRPVLELIRVFLTPGALADSLAGYALAASLLGEPFGVARFISALAASIFLYWFGMATNDLFDQRKDRSGAPERPLPSGRISVRAAVLLSSGLGAIGLLASWLAGALAPGVAVLTFVLLYNGGGKHVPVLGNLLMGCCRAGNLLLGAAAAASIENVIAEPPLYLSAAMLGLHVAGITAVSLLEDRDYRPATFHALATPLLAVPLVLGALQPLSTGVWFNSILLLWLLLTVQRRAASRCSPAHPAAVYVRGALASIFLVDAGFVWTFCPGGALAYGTTTAIYALALFGWWWKRQWLQSGGPDT